ncbi:MAG: hypothetical protein R2827_04970, partial [Bdellovibrionales bacterium]
GHSLVIRLFLGIMAEIPLEYLALYMAGERIAFGVCDLILRPRFNSSYQLYRWGLIGMFIKIISDFLLIPTFLLLSDSEVMFGYFIAFSGILMGAGQSLTHQTFDLFYLKNLKNYIESMRKVSHFAHIKNKDNILTLYAGVQLFLFMAGLGIAYFLYYFHEPTLILILPILFNVLFIFLVSSDASKLKPFFESNLKDISQPPKKFSVWRTHLALINSLSMLGIVPSCYFLVISLFHSEAIKMQFDVWVVLILFTLGYEFAGSLLVEYFARLFRHSHKLVMTVFAILLLAVSLFFARFQMEEFDILPWGLSYLLFLFYPLVMSVCLKMIGHLSLRQINQFGGKSLGEKIHNVTVSTVPGNLAIGAYCLWILLRHDGLPSISSALDFSLYIAMGISFFVTLYWFLVTPEEQEKLEVPHVE